MNRLGIVGASGVCGQEAVKILNQLPGIEVESLYLFASAKSAGTKIKFRGNDVTIKKYESPKQFRGINFVILLTPSFLSKEIIEKGPELCPSTVFIDNSSAFRLDPRVPLVIPEITPKELYRNSQIIANPNCSTIILLNGLYYLTKLDPDNPIADVDVTTFQAVSGAGKAGLDELKSQATAYPETAPAKKFGRQILCNVIPHESELDPTTGYNQEEVKLIKETKKILQKKNFPIDVECSRAGVERCHTEIVKVRFAKDLVSDLTSHKELDQLVQKAWGNAPGVKILTSLTDKNAFIDPLQAAGTNDVYVCRVRMCHNDPTALKFRLVGDQIRVGAAWNALKIFKALTMDYMNE